MHVKDSLRLGWQRGFAALQSLFVAGACLWGVAFAVWVLYNNAPPFTKALDALGELKNYWGFYFDMLTVGFMAGMVPSSIMSLRRLCGTVAPNAPLSLRRELLLVVSHTVMFSLYGIWIDLFYNLQTYLFGAGMDLATVANKVAVDQGLLCPILDVPLVQMILLYIDCSLGCTPFNVEVSRREMWTVHGILSDWWLPAILTTWLVWIPSLFVVYSLPGALQFIMFSIVMTFWTMIQLVVMGNARQDYSPPVVCIEMCLEKNVVVIATESSPIYSAAESPRYSAVDLTEALQPKRLQVLI
jgi:hypothetical protein